MASITDDRAPAFAAGRNALIVTSALCLVAGAAAIAVAAVMWFGGGALAGYGIGTSTDPVALGAFGAAGLFLVLGGALAFARPGAGGGIALTGVVIYVA